MTLLSDRKYYHKIVCVLLRMKILLFHINFRYGFDILNYEFNQ